MEKKINVLFLKAGSVTPEFITIDHDVESMQGLVGGCFDIVPARNYIPSDLNLSPLGKYDIFVNDEGLLMQLPPNICLNPRELIKKNYDNAGILVGDIFLAGCTRDGESVSVLPDDVPALTVALKRLMLNNDFRHAQKKE